MTDNQLYQELEKININITPKIKEQLKKYYQLLIEWNEKINLTAITKLEDVNLKHFYDSATLVKAIDFENQENFCDIGTGAGFPGIIIKILYPNLNVTLVDALQKRVKFLELVVSELELKKIEVIHARAEEYAKENREKFDIVTSRAVANLKILSEYSIPLVKENKYFIPMKADIAQEIIDIEKTLNKLKGKLEETITFELPNHQGNRTLLKIKKLSKTPTTYPRAYGVMKKRPL